MLDVWRRQGVDDLLHRALAGGAVLTGGSAGGLCWFEAGTTDSFGPTLQVLHDGLGMIKGSYCPHYDAEDQRRPLFHAALLDGSLQMGYASWNRVAIRFTADGQVVEAVTSEPGGRALKVYARDGRIIGSKSEPPARACQPDTALVVLADPSHEQPPSTRMAGGDHLGWVTPGPVDGSKNRGVSITLNLAGSARAEWDHMPALIADDARLVNTWNRKNAY